MIRQRCIRTRAAALDRRLERARAIGVDADARLVGKRSALSRALDGDVDVERRGVAFDDEWMTLRLEEVNRHPAIRRARPRRVCARAVGARADARGGIRRVVRVVRSRVRDRVRGRETRGRCVVRSIEVDADAGVLGDRVPRRGARWTLGVVATAMVFHILAARARGREDWGAGRRTAASRRALDGPALAVGERLELASVGARGFMGRTSFPAHRAFRYDALRLMSYSVDCALGHGEITAARECVECVLYPSLRQCGPFLFYRDFETKRCDGGDFRGRASYAALEMMDSLAWYAFLRFARSAFRRRSTKDSVQPENSRSLGRTHRRLGRSHARF